MNAEVTAPAEAAKPKAREVDKIQMTDGRIVEFVSGSKQKMLKDALVVLPDGSTVPVDEATDEQVQGGKLAIRLDFRNGSTRTYPLNEALFHRFAAHGGLQKYGDHLAGGVKNDDGSPSEDLDDWAAATDALHDRIMSGDWSKGREGGVGGISILIKALMEYTGRTVEEVRNHIKDWTPKDRRAMRVDPEIKPIIDRLESEKDAAAAKSVDTDALKSKLLDIGKAAQATA
jgi:hypothetical protein